MAVPAPKKPLYPNPFYVLVVLAGTAFVITTLGWLVAPMIQQQAHKVAEGGAAPSPGSLAMAAWIDRWAVTALTIEVVVMVVAGVLAMAVDRWFPSKAGRA
jgi:hypothetical protein